MRILFLSDRIQESTIVQVIDPIFSNFKKAIDCSVGSNPGAVCIGLVAGLSNRNECSLCSSFWERT